MWPTKPLRSAPSGEVSNSVPGATAEPATNRRAIVIGSGMVVDRGRMVFCMSGSNVCVCCQLSRKGSVLV